MSALTINLANETAEKLDALARAQDSSRSMIATKAIEEFVEKESWQLGEIQAGLTEAQQGDFATADEIAAVLAKYREASSGT